MNDRAIIGFREGSKYLEHVLENGMSTEADGSKKGSPEFKDGVYQIDVSLSCARVLFQMNKPIDLLFPEELVLTNRAGFQNFKQTIKAVDNSLEEEVEEKTEEENKLDGLTKAQLQKLMELRELDYKPQWNKAKLIEELLEYE